MSTLFSCSYWGCFILMIKPIHYSLLIIKPMVLSFIDLASPKIITYMWNLGSLLGMVLLIQIITGLFLSFYYISSVSIAFNSVIYIIREVNLGWLFRIIHANGARLFFVACYLHIGRGLYYRSYQLNQTWIRGTIIYLLLIATGFLGYVLPWGQISLWGAIVITNLVRIVPLIGVKLIQWVWGGYSIGTATLNCFYSLHYIIPFIIIVIVPIHLLTLHKYGSRTPIGLINNLIKIKFDGLFTIKDSVNISVFLIFINLVLYIPFALIETENFIIASSINSPLHIVPEWYFLYIYAILRAVPNKVGGVIAICLALALIFLIRLLYKRWKINTYSNYRALFWLLIFVFILLTWVGRQPVEYPFIQVGQIITIVYFMCFLAILWFNLTCNKIFLYQWSKEYTNFKH